VCVFVRARGGVFVWVYECVHAGVVRTCMCVSGGESLKSR